MLAVIVSLMIGCVLGVVAMSLAVMSKSDEREEYEALKRIERRHKFTGAES